ncbi:Signal transduction histidine kinase [Mariniphaga anaerophila]|uniref:histidine kinase n=1 Tax=Mariniphaga anaerophila TaxID=1484053 RepID=A0A1M5FL49_9BACT|nr:hybrid sensor histidine kinase/response regulator transcription factor [Mariniphaga anaerophila]SHF92215.1 Signal transduction histidine kinase [Mariniphaga anaerophila]
MIKLLLFFCIFLFSINSWSNSDRINFFHYTNENGLPSSYAKDITQDYLGFIWVATRNTISRFDGKHFKNFTAVDYQGNISKIWGMRFVYSNDTSLIIETTNNDFYAFNFELEQFEPYNILNELQPGINVQDSDQGLWITKNSSISHFDIVGQKFLMFKERIEFADIPEEVVLMHVREKNNLIVALTSTQHIMVFDTERSLQRQFELPKDIVQGDIGILFLDKNNNAWLGEYGNGLYRINLTNGQISRFSSEVKGNRYILHNMVHDICEDELGRTWIGTENGLCIWSPYTESFSYHQYDINNPQGLNTNPIYNIFCDREGNMWLGTYFGGINFWGSNTTFFKYWEAGQAAHHISGNAVSCITEDNKGNVWIGMEDAGINCIDPEKEIITRVIDESVGLSYNNVHDILFDTENRMWIATYSGGVNILDMSTNRFDYINTVNNPVLPADNIYSLQQMGDSIFISTSAGVAVYNLNSKNISLFNDEVFDNIQVESMHKDKDRMWFSSAVGIYFTDRDAINVKMFDKFPDLKNINFVKVDSKGRIWTGDYREGLWGYDYSKDTVYHYNERNGFPFTWIFSMEEGIDGTFWVSGDKGLVKFNPEINKINWFNKESGLPFEQFNYRASFRDKSGMIYFGGNNGMVSFNEKWEQEEKKEMNVVFRGMQLFNQELKPGQTSALKISLNEHPEINLKYKENVFTIEYSALNFQNKGNCHYAYYLEGFENDWNLVGNRDFATYTNLNPGTYYFHVKASVDNNQWDNQFNTVKVVIEPPFWLSCWGFVIYFLLMVLALSIFIAVSRKIRKSRLQVEIERREKMYLTDLNNFKLEFFTNVSHELRTPLTLIIGPLTRIINEEKLTPALNNKMKGIKNNASRLLFLINQLLDFRKTEIGKEKLTVSQQEIGKLIKQIEEYFSNAAKDKGIELEFVYDKLNSKVWIDSKKIETILVNIISNALKYTNEGGTVSVYSELVSDNDEDSVNAFMCTVKDNGVGIEISKLNKIFERFYRDDLVSSGRNDEGGSGIGLALANNLVKLHKGSINVTSEKGKGSVFTIKIPVARKEYKDDEIILAEKQYNIQTLSRDKVTTILSTDKELHKISKKSNILVIDDNRELLDFITETLVNDYSVTTAVDGAQGIEKVGNTNFDIIISDVMMPYIDGFELTRKLKSDIQTSHIPIILLTAKSGDESKFEGLQTGADYYIEKPFLPHILKQLIENVLKTRQNLFKRFKSDLTMLPKDVAVVDSDIELIEKITKLVEDNIDIPNLDVQFIIDEIGISRSLLHLKLKKLTDCSATEFVRSIRLREAARLIAERKCNISEAAYRTGFSTPAYFSRRFKEYFGKSPKDYFNN